MVKKISLFVALFVLLGVLATYFSYADFRDKRLSQLETESEVFQSSQGPVEYVMNGETGPVILFLHGTVGGYDNGFSWPGFRVLTISRFGYLRSSLTVGRTPEDQAEACRELLTHLGIDRVTVFGVSGGGPSAISFASLYPQSTNALIGIATITQSLTPIENIPAYTQSDFLLWAVAKIADTSLGLSLVSTFVENEAEKEWLATGSESLLSDWPPSRRADGFTNDLLQRENLNLLEGREITAPTLIIHGNEDDAVPYSQGQWLTENIEGSTLLTIEGGSHLIHMTHSAEVFGAMGQFMSEVIAATPD